MSDQDFFFDDEEDAQDKSAKGDKSASAPSKRPSSGTAPAKRPARTSAPAPAPSFFERETSMAVALLLSVIGLLLGVIIGLLLNGVLNPGASTAGIPAASESNIPNTTDASGTPTNLTPDQLNSGKLPAGHPDISGMGTATP